MELREVAREFDGGWGGDVDPLDSCRGRPERPRPPRPRPEPRPEERPYACARRWKWKPRPFVQIGGGEVVVEEGVVGL